MSYATRSMLAAVAVVSAGLFTSSAHGAATIYNLGTLGGSESSGSAINASGQVTGWSYTTGGVKHAFLYTGTPGSGGAMADLGTLGGTNSVGNAINASGQVAGGSDRAGGQHAFLYTGTPGSGGAMADLGTLGGTNSYGYAINASGQVAGYADTTAYAPHAFRYTGTPGSGGVMADLGTLGGSYSAGYAINASGQVAGWSHTTAGEAHAIRYTGTPGSGGVMADLGTLAGGWSYGRAINASGQVAGESSTQNESGAFLYTGTPGVDGQRIDLGKIEPDPVYTNGMSNGRAINASGQVAGQSIALLGYNICGVPEWGYHAFLYTGTPGVDAQMIDLDVWLKANNPTEGAKWTLTAAYGLTDSGLIAGTGTYNDGPGGLSDGARAFILDASSLVPEPASLSLLALGGLALLRRRSGRYMHRRNGDPSRRRKLP